MDALSHALISALPGAGFVVASLLGGISTDALPQILVEASVRLPQCGTDFGALTAVSGDRLCDSQAPVLLLPGSVVFAAFSPIFWNERGRSFLAILMW